MGVVVVNRVGVLYMYVFTLTWVSFLPFPSYPLKYEFRGRLKPSQSVNCPRGDPHACASETAYLIPCSTQGFLKCLPVLQFPVMYFFCMIPSAIFNTGTCMGPQDAAWFRRSAGTVPQMTNFMQHHITSCVYHYCTSCPSVCSSSTM